MRGWSCPLIYKQSCRNHGIGCKFSQLRVSRQFFGALEKLSRRGNHRKSEGFRLFFCFLFPVKPREAASEANRITLLNPSDPGLYEIRLEKLFHRRHQTRHRRYFESMIDPRLIDVSPKPEIFTGDISTFTRQRGILGGRSPQGFQQMLKLVSLLPGDSKS